MADSPVVLYRHGRYHDRDAFTVSAASAAAAASASGHPHNKERSGLDSLAVCRASEITQGRKLIEETEARLKKLERDHDLHVERASLLTDADRAWSRLSSCRRRDVQAILWAMQSPHQPVCLQWEHFDSSFPTWIRHDRNLFLARLQQMEGMEELYLDKPYPVPTKWRGDKQVMLEICKRNSHALQYATKALKDDREVVMAAITQRYHFAPLALQYASPKLRGDRRIVRAALGREYGIRAFSLIAPRLQDDPKWAILAIRKSGDEYSRLHEHFSDLPEEFREDEDVVLEAVKRRGSNLRYVTDQSLLTDYDIIHLACSNFGPALMFVPDCPARQSILESANDLMMVLTRGGGQLLTEAPKTFHTDPPFLLAAMENGLTSPALGNYYKTDKAFFMELVAASSNVSDFYRELPEPLQQKQDIVQAVLQNDTIDDALLCSLVSKHDFLVQNKSLLLDCGVRRGCLSFLGTSPLKHSMEHDKNFVLQVLHVDGSAYEFVHDNLKDDPEVAKAALDDSSEEGEEEVGQPIPAEMIYAKFPKVIWEDESVVELMIRKLGAEEALRIRAHINMDMLRSRSIFLACMESGWPSVNIPYSVRAAFENDEQIILSSLKYSDGLYNNMGATLQCDRDFMEQAIRADPRILAYASRELRYDYELMLLAVGTSRKALQCVCHRSNGESMSRLVEFAEQVRERLDIAETFIMEFLRGVAIAPTTTLSPPRKRARKTKTDQKVATTIAKTKADTTSSDQCHLPMLDCGLETGMALKRLIAEFANVPMGEEYKLLRGASENLAFWGY